MTKTKTEISDLESETCRQQLTLNIHDFSKIIEMKTSVDFLINKNINTVPFLTKYLN